MKNHSVSTSAMIWPRSRMYTPSAARNQQIPSVNSSCGISSTGNQSTAAGTACRMISNPATKTPAPNISVTNPDTT